MTQETAFYELNANENFALKNIFDSPVHFSN